MRSTDRAASQRGTSLIEAVVASALMGIGVVGGLTAWDTATISADKATRIAWANCIVRSEMDGILSAQYSEDYPHPYPVPQAFAADGTVEVDGVPLRGGADQLITVKAYDPTSNHTVVLAQVSALKARALAGGKSIDDPVGGNGPAGDVGQGCPLR